MWIRRRDPIEDDEGQAAVVRVLALVTQSIAICPICDLSWIPIVAVLTKPLKPLKPLDGTPFAS